MLFRSSWALPLPLAQTIRMFLGAHSLAFCRSSASAKLKMCIRDRAEYGLSIRRKPGYGICVVGSETNRRICIAAQRDESRPVEQQIQELVSRVLEKDVYKRQYMDIAIANAKRLDKQNEGRKPSESAPGTKVYELVEMLRPYLLDTQ